MRAARLVLIPLALTVNLGSPVCSANASPDEPRITVIVADDFGWDLLFRAHTPNIDALMAEGLVFSEAWAYPSCAPTRAALLTGRHATRTGMGSNVSSPGEPGLALSETTLAEVLDEPVDLFGKWHVSQRPTDPNTQGFRNYRGGLGNLKWKGYYEWKRTDNGVVSNEYRYATRVTTNDALASDAPVRIVCYHAPHGPFETPPGGSSTTDEGKVLEMVAFMDREIGRLLAEQPDGYVFLFGDNGTATKFGGQKGSLLEGGIHVPWVVRGPGIAAGTTAQLVNVVDMHATLADMRGLTSSAEDSHSILPILQGGQGTRLYNYAEEFNFNGDLSDRSWAIRNRSWKLIHFHYPFPTDKLFSMPGEVPVLPPYSAQEQAAIDLLESQLPF